MKKKVLLLANEYTTIINFRMELLQRLIKENYKIFVALPKNGNNLKIKDLGCEIVELKISRKGMNPIEDLRTILAIKKIFTTLKPDVVFTFTIKPNIYGGFICKILKIPYIVNITGLGIGLDNKGILQKILLILYKLSINKANKIFFQNEHDMQFMLKKQIIKTNYELIPGSGVNLERFKLLEFPNDKIVNFLYIARVMKEKGIEEYINAAKYIKRKYPFTRFHVCGLCEDNYERKIQHLNDKNIIIYHGQVNKIEKMHVISQCTIHPSFYPEGMSNVLLESAASGRPVITTNRPGCKEIVDDGVTGFLIRQQDSNDLIDKIEKFLNLPWEERKHMGLCGRKKVEKQFDRNIVIQKYIDEIRYLNL